MINTGHRSPLNFSDEMASKKKKKWTYVTTSDVNGPLACEKVGKQTDRQTVR